MGLVRHNWPLHAGCVENILRHPLGHNRTRPMNTGDVNLRGYEEMRISIKDLSHKDTTNLAIIADLWGVNRGDYNTTLQNWHDTFLKYARSMLPNVINFVLRICSIFNTMLFLHFQWTYGSAPGGVGWRGVDVVGWGGGVWGWRGVGAGGGGGGVG